MFTPKKTRDYEALIKSACWDAMQREGLPMIHDQPIFLHCIFRFAVPKSAKHRIGQYHLHKPDVTNLLKAVEDACNQTFYRDDACLAVVSGTKWWSDINCVDVTFSW
jgi:Holliday junction resolvase RusA-like endonuclease